MNTELSELFALEKKGLYKEALEHLARVRSQMGDSPVTKWNLDLLEQRLRVQSGESPPPTPMPIIGNEKSITSRVGHSPEGKTWSAIITMWKRTDYLAEQLNAIRRQSIAPQEIIIILNESHIPESRVREVGGDGVRIIKSDINSLYSRWALAYIAQGNYVCVFDDDVIPGEFWVANAMRACDRYHALVGPNGRIHNRKGHQGYWKWVAPVSRPEDEKFVDCGETDIYCDWVCNSYFFKREWVGHALRDVRHKDAFKTFDDIQLATSLWMHGGIRCITPMQPSFDKRFHGSLQPQYGRDAHAIWKTNPDQHSADRKAYIESLIEVGYVPVQRRDNLHRMHLVVPFGEREFLDRCLMSIKGQDYRNYTCTLIDDCHDGEDSLGLLRHLRLDGPNFRYIKTKKKAYPLRAREIATDMLQANPADIVIHLDGDDWLPYPDVLSRLNRVYRKGGVLATYGNALCCRDAKGRDFKSYTPYDMSRRWSVAQKDAQAPVFPFRRIDEPEVKGGWGNAPWCGMHLRSFQYAKWLGLDRKTFRDSEGQYLRVATDAAIFIPILDSCHFSSIAFVPDLSCVYRNAGNTIHSKKEVSAREKANALAAIANAKQGCDTDTIRNVLLGGLLKVVAPSDGLLLHDGWGTHPPIVRAVAESARMPAKVVSCLVTIVTPDYLPDALLGLVSCKRNLRLPCETYVLIATEDEVEVNACAKLLEGSGLTAMFPGDLRYTKEYSRALARKYKLKSDEYRWAMKPVVLMELLLRGNALAVFLDPDTYAVSDVTDIHREMARHPISVFPHFRDSDHERSRSILYKDGFFNGGMLGATQDGIPHLERLYERCLNEMVKDPARSRWDDQKYFDLFAIEVPNLYVNHDRGINYNYWNYEPVEGLVAPSQRSYLLKSGYFVRHWHVSSMLIKKSIEASEPKFAVYRPLVVIYLLSLLFSIPLLIATTRWKAVKQEAHDLGLMRRYREIEEKLKKLSASIPLHETGLLLSLAQDVKPNALGNFLEHWVTSLKRSMLFDNRELFLQVLNGLLGEAPGIDDVVGSIRKSDLRSLTDEIVASPDSGLREIDGAQEEGAGEVVRRQLLAMQESAINY